MPNYASTRYRHGGSIDDGAGVDHSSNIPTSERGGVDASARVPRGNSTTSGGSASAPTIESKNRQSDAFYDLICIGFGPASLAIAIALHERAVPPRVLFLERQPKFAWHSGMLLPGTRMQVSFMKDLATFRNPRSKFTFINYLHLKGRLVSFTNLSTFLPLREEYNDYLAWCASHFSSAVSYGVEALRVAPVPSQGPTASWEVYTRPVGGTANPTPLRAKTIVIAVGGRPRFPPTISPSIPHPRILHSSGYSTTIRTLLPDPTAVYNIAVVGGGQSSAEIFSDLHSRFPASKTSLIIRGHALRPSDDSPFVNEIFNPDRVDAVFSLPPDVRAAAIESDRATNYSVVRPALLDELYIRLYQQRLWGTEEQHRIMALREVVGVENGEAGVGLLLRDMRTGQELASGLYDAVIFGTGYARDAHRQMLKPLEKLMKNGECVVGRDYGVLFRDGTVVEGAGVYLQGCCEGTHGVSSIFPEGVG